jgi:hypothetical protein
MPESAAWSPPELAGWQAELTDLPSMTRCRKTGSITRWARNSLLDSCH